MEMSVSPGPRKNGKKTVYVMFRDGERYAEILFPEYKVISNNGFEDDEISQLLLYMKAEQSSILELAKGINPIKAMMR